MTEVIYLVTILYAAYVIDDVAGEKPVYILLTFLSLMFLGGVST